MDKDKDTSSGIEVITLSDDDEKPTILYDKYEIKKKQEKEEKPTTTA